MSTPLRILFVIRAAEHVPRYDSIIRALSAAGHAVTVLLDRDWSAERDLATLAGYERQFPNLRHGWLINRGGRWAWLLFIVRSLLTYRRYLTVPDQSAFFRDRWLCYMPFWLRMPLRFPGVARFLKTERARRLLVRVEARAPADPQIVSQVRAADPDVLIAPVGGIRVLSPSAEYLKTGRALGIPTVSPTVSWDSLTTKALITVHPDIFLLWNECHAARAVEHHGAAREQIHLIGAPVFDRWFDGLAPSASRGEFCRRHGLSPDRPYLLYLGSAKGTATDETWLIRDLRRELNQSAYPALRELQIVVRPHPSNARVYRGLSLPGVLLIPKGSGTEAEELQRSYDTYHHATAVTGIFTSAMMEAQIMDRPVLVMLLDKYQETQLKTQHFQDFVKGDSLELTRTMGELCAALKEILAGNDARKEKRRRFVLQYIRPLGIGVSAGEAAVREIEQLVRARAASSWPFATSA